MNATQTATPQRVNWNGRKAAPTCACGKRAYCDNSCNTFASSDPYAKRREFERMVLLQMEADGCAAEGESFADWKRRTGGAM